MLTLGTDPTTSIVKGAWDIFLSQSKAAILQPDGSDQFNYVSRELPFMV